jgi:hypothetical protein
MLTGTLANRDVRNVGPGPLPRGFDSLVILGYLEGQIAL